MGLDRGDITHLSFSGLEDREYLFGPVRLALGRILPVYLPRLPVRVRSLPVHWALGRILPIGLRLLPVQLSHITHLVGFTEGPETGLVAVVVAVDPWFLSFLSVHIVKLAVHFVFLPVLLLLPVDLFLPVHPLLGPSSRAQVRPLTRVIHIHYVHK